MNQDRRVIFKEKRNVNALRWFVIVITFIGAVFTFEGIRAGLTVALSGHTPSVLGFIETRPLNEEAGIYVSIIAGVFFLVMSYFLLKMSLNGITYEVHADDENLYIMRNGWLNKEVSIAKSSVIKVIRKREIGNHDGMRVRGYRVFLLLRGKGGKEKKFMLHRLPDSPHKQVKQLIKGIRREVHN